VLVVVARNDPGAEATARLAPVSRIGSVGVIVGSTGTLVFGVVLALSIDGYALWDGWIVAALILWVIGVGTGMRSEAELGRGNRRVGIRMHTISSIAIILVLADMIWKPGA
jgi:hypothetical protein